MEKKIFTQNVLFAEQTLYRISKTMLHEQADCQDAVQTAILKAYEKLDTLKNESYFKTWLIRILINECYAIQKSKSRFVPYENYMQENLMYEENQKSDLESFLQKLPTKIRLTMILFYVEGYKIDEIGSILKIPSGTVKSRLSKGRRLLQRYEKEVAGKEVNYGTI